MAQADGMLVDGVSVYDFSGMDFTKLPKEALELIKRPLQIREEINNAFPFDDAGAASLVSAHRCKYLREVLEEVGTRQIVMSWRDDRRPAGMKVESMAWGLNDKGELWIVPYEETQGIPLQEGYLLGGLRAKSVLVQNDRRLREILSLKPELYTLLGTMTKQGAPAVLNAASMDVMTRSFLDAPLPINYVVFNEKGEVVDSNYARDQRVQWNNGRGAIAMPEGWTAVLYGRLVNDRSHEFAGYQEMFEEACGDRRGDMFISIVEGAGKDKFMPYNKPACYNASGVRLPMSEAEKYQEVSRTLPHPWEAADAERVLRKLHELSTSAYGKSGGVNINADAPIDSPSSPNAKEISRNLQIIMARDGEIFSGANTCEVGVNATPARVPAGVSVKK